MEKKRQATTTNDVTKRKLIRGSPRRSCRGYGAAHGQSRTARSQYAIPVARGCRDTKRPKRPITSLTPPYTDASFPPLVGSYRPPQESSIDAPVFARLFRRRLSRALSVAGARASISGARSWRRDAARRARSSRARPRPLHRRAARRRAHPPSSTPPSSTPPGGRGSAPVDRGSLVEPSQAPRTGPATSAPTVVLPETRDSERVKDQSIGANPSDVYAEDWWMQSRPVLRVPRLLPRRAPSSSTTSRSAGSISAPTPSGRSRSTTATPTRPTTPQRGQPLRRHAERRSAPTRPRPGANMRFRLNPELHISDNLRVLSQIDMLDNLVLGSTPGGLRNAPRRDGNARLRRRSQASLHPARRLRDHAGARRPPASTASRTASSVKRAWGEYATPRRPAPLRPHAEPLGPRHARERRRRLRLRLAVDGRPHHVHRPASSRSISTSPARGTFANEGAHQRELREPVGRASPTISPSSTT